jgi:uncharacterized peroxidase-related enzyme
MFIQTAPPAQADPAQAAAYQTATAQFGFLPNWAMALGGRPSALAGWQQLNAAIRDGMDRRRYELVCIAAAKQVRSTYCAMAHTWMLTDWLNLVPAEQLPQILTDRANAAGLSDADRAVMGFAEQIARDAHAITEQDVQRLRDLGLSDTDVLDVALAAAARCFFAKVLDAVGAQADRPISDALGPEVSALLTVGRPVDTATPDRSRDSTPGEA